MLKRIVPAGMLLVLATLSILPSTLAQTSDFGSWVADPNNIATPGFVYATPPAGFNPLTASDFDLEQWGFPPRPNVSDVAAYAEWEKIVSLQRITPQLTFTKIYQGPAQFLQIGNTNATSNNWSGYVLDGANGTFKVNETQVSADWNIPSVAQAIGTCNSTWDYSTQWVGFDGWGSSDVLQAGSEADATCSSTLYSFWYEWYPNAETRVSSPVAQPGDWVAIQVWYTTTSPYGHAYWADYRSGLSASVGFNPPSGTTFEGNSAEWVVERPTVSGSLADLANYGGMNVFAPEARIGTSSFYSPSSPPSGATLYSVSMVCPPWNPSSACTTTTTISNPDNGFFSVIPGTIQDSLYLFDLSPAY
jgi:hypothetical protein